MNLEDYNKKNDYKNTVIIFFVCVVLVITRIIFDNNNKLVYIVASINLISFIYIVFTIIDKVKDKIYNRLEKLNIPYQIYNREQKAIFKRLYLPVIIICILFAVIYFKFFSTNLYNDIISIVTLCLSIKDSEISEFFSEKYKIN